MKKPVKKIRKVEYWSCGKKDHYHIKKEVAARCIARKPKDDNFIKTCAEKKIRNDRLIRMWCDGKNNSEIAKELGSSYSVVSGKIEHFIQMLCSDAKYLTAFEDGWTRCGRGPNYVMDVITMDLAQAMVKRLNSWPEGHKRRHDYEYSMESAYEWLWRDGPLMFAGIVRDKNEEEIERDRKKEEEKQWIRDHPSEWKKKQDKIRIREESRRAKKMMTRRKEITDHYSRAEWEEAQKTGFRKSSPDLSPEELKIQQTALSRYGLIPK